MSEYEDLSKLFLDSDIYTVEFVCKLCNNTIFYRQYYCKNCMHTIEWPKIDNEGTYLKVYL